MAVVVDSDAAGVFVVVECNGRGCYGHVAGRPGPDMTAYDLLCAVVDEAADAGWLMAGKTWCPRHATTWRRARTLGRVGEGFTWADVKRGADRGALRPS
jgi:hypothetical protein